MTDAMTLVHLLSETETAFTRESETILAGQGPDATLVAHKAELIDQLMELAPAAAHLAAATDADGRHQMRLGFERMLAAAARNENVLRGALRGTRLVVNAISQATEPYPARRQSSGSSPGAVAPSGQFNRLA